VPEDRNRFGGLPNLAQLSLPSSLSRRSAQLKATQKKDFIVLVLSIAVLVIVLVALAQYSRFDYEHKHRFTEHEHVVVFKLPTDNFLLFPFDIRNSLFEIRC
jgi:hypothetical protein